MNVAAYLTRIGYGGPASVSLETLAALHRAHLEAVPFENLDIHLGRPIVLDEEALYRKIVDRRRGGFCYELNGLFARLLAELGFRVTLLSAGVARESGGFGPEFDHLALCVDLEKPWLADVGFGECFRDPLRLADGVTQGEYRLARDGEAWTLLRAGVPQYRFTLTPRRLAEYAEMCRYHQTSPLSSFTRGRLCTRATAAGRITLSELKLTVTEGAARTERLLSGEEEFTAILHERFGVVV